MGEGNMYSKGCQIYIWCYSANLPSVPPVTYMTLGMNIYNHIGPHSSTSFQ